MLKLNRMKLIIGIIFGLLLVGKLFAQGKEKEIFLPRFDYEIVSFPGKSADKSRTEIYVWVRNTHLQYIAQDTLYSARYQINLAVYNQAGASILTGDQTFMVTEKNYAATIDPKVKKVHRFELQLPPDDYRFKFRLLDLNSNRSRSQERDKKVRTFEKNKLEISDIIFVNKASTDSIKPENVYSSFRVPMHQKIYIYAEIVNPLNKGEIKIDAALSQKKDGKEKFRFSQNFVSTKDITKVLLEVKEENLTPGQNQLHLRVADSGQSKAIRKDVKFVSDNVASPTDLSIEEMIGPLMYVTDGDDWKKLKKASDKDREKVFKEFWAKRDPNPGSPENELFNEFYKRVDAANRSFAFSRKTGWRTDRGRVFIVFGPPDRIEHGTPSRYNQGEYEIWYYEELREKFVFYDEYGFGEFRLVSGNVRPAY